MTPTQITITKYLVLILLCFGAGFYLRDVQADRDINATKLEGATAQIDAHKQFEAKIEVRDIANRKLNADYQALQITASQDLNEKLTENSRLASDLGVARGMQLRGFSCPSPTAVGSTAAAGMAADNAPVFSGETRQLVFDLRADIVTERAISAGWRDYAAYLDGQIREHQRLHHDTVKR
jgi:hypothetical protein